MSSLEVSYGPMDSEGKGKGKGKRMVKKLLSVAACLALACVYLSYMKDFAIVIPECNRKRQGAIASICSLSFLYGTVVCASCATFFCWVAMLLFKGYSFRYIIYKSAFLEDKSIV